ncbi:hypothetical protein L210DRAFT_2474093 [Boletus edulis BED1]|uniref:Uncharacterized protein n=1 Tax=Boletus edulis BED1 TaxID=1328754 RepID=A0AAD4BPW7_BOLED|nr:hypothetical protein L210DRAFT_2474093 [Boletus edulis BED1]
MSDLEEVIILDQEALDLRPQGHPDRTISLNNLALCLSTRYKQLEIMQDLDEAIVLDREAFPPRPHPDRSTPPDTLTRYLCDRFRSTRQLEDQEELFSLYAQAFELREQWAYNHNIMYMVAAHVKRQLLR